MLKLSTSEEKSKRLVRMLSIRPAVKKHLHLLKNHHKDSYSHCKRVAQYCVKLGIINKFGEKDLELLGLSGLLHDIGKCDIKKEILTKNARLNDEERKTINQHARLAFIRLAEDEFGIVKRIVVAHHEQKINSYPRSGKDRRSHTRDKKDRRTYDKKIDILTQILAAADIFDALKEKRSYKDPLNKGQIKQIMLDEYEGDPIFTKQLMP